MSDVLIAKTETECKFYTTEHFNHNPNSHGHKYYAKELEMAFEHYISLQGNPDAQAAFVNEQTDMALQMMKVSCHI
jgi:hypothetical protein